MVTRSIAIRLTLMAFGLMLVCGSTLVWLVAPTAGGWSVLSLLAVTALPAAALGAAMFYLAVRAWLHVPAQILIERLATMSIGPCDLSKRLNMPRPDEIGAMGMHVDAFVARIEEVLLNTLSLSTDADVSARAIAGESQRLGGCPRRLRTRARRPRREPVVRRMQ